MKNNKSGEIPNQVWNDFFDDGIISRTKTLRDDERGGCGPQGRDDEQGRVRGFTICHPELVSGSCRSNGFTLIELLVVVLIIGILAAVAVPQYQKAVEKSRASTMLTVLKSIHDAQEAYFMANGAYADKFDKLDIDMPAGGTPNANGKEITYPNGRSYDLWGGGSSIRGLSDQGYILEYYMSGSRYCYAEKNNTKANQVCSSLGKLASGTDANYTSYSLY